MQNLELQIANYLKQQNLPNLSKVDYEAAQQLKDFMREEIPEPTNNSYSLIVHHLVDMQLCDTNWLKVYQLLQGN